MNSCNECGAQMWAHVSAFNNFRHYVHSKDKKSLITHNAIGNVLP